MLHARGAHTLTPLPSGKVLACGGYNEQPLYECDLFDPESNAWSATEGMGTDRMTHTATLLPNGKVLVAGGQATPHMQPTATAELYDPASGTWTDAASMSLARVAHAATLLPNGRVLVTGGTADGEVFTYAEIYDPGEDRWTPARNMASARLGHSATLLPSGRVLVTGTSAVAEVYDPAEDEWAPGADAGVARGGHAAVALGVDVLVIGGYTQNVPLASAQLGREGGAWTATGAMSTPRGAPAAALLDDGRVLVAGGNPGTGQQQWLASAEIYNPVTKAFSPGGSMGVARIGHVAVRLNDGRVLVTGGYAPYFTTKTTDIWTPTTTVSMSSALDAGRQSLGGGRPVSLDVTNTGASPLLIDGAAVGGAQSDDFELLENGCTAAVRPGQACRITMRFAPVGSERALRS